MIRPAVLVLVLLDVWQPEAALAYVDPVTGGLFAQILSIVVVVAVGGYVFLKKQVVQAAQRIWSLFSSRRR